MNTPTLTRRRLLKASVANTLATALLTPNTRASTWPDKVIRMVVAFPAGGPTDTAARLIAQKLSDRLGQSVIVENKPGASGSIGTAAFIKSPADGYTISMFGMPALIAPIVYGNNLYDSRKDFSCVSTVYDVPYVLVVNPKALAGVDNLQQLMAVAKTQDLSYATRAWACSGTPVDCVKLATGVLLDQKPDILISGINHGANSSISVVYSGTMSAAMEGAIEGILSARPDAVVLDIQLQGGSGLEVIRAVRARAPEIAFVILTGHPNPRYRMAFAREGARAFLDKCSEFEQISTEILAASALREAGNPVSSSDIH